MKKVIIVFLLATIGMVAQVKESRSVTDFNQVSVAQGVELNYTVANKSKITVEADTKELLKEVKVEVKGKVLLVYIAAEKGKWGSSSLRKFRNVKVVVEGPNLVGVKLASSAIFIGKDPMKVDDFVLDVSSSGYFKGGIKSKTCKVNVSSSGKVKSDIQTTNTTEIKTSSSADFNGTVSAKELRLSSSSSSSILLSGDVKVVNAELSSSSSIDGKNLKAIELNVAASSSSLGSFFVSEKISASAASSAKVTYYGTPTNVDVKKSSSGKIIKG